MRGSRASWRHAVVEFEPALFSVEVVLRVAEVDFGVGFGGGLFWLGHGLRESWGGSVDGISRNSIVGSRIGLHLLWSIAHFCCHQGTVLQEPYAVWRDANLLIIYLYLVYDRPFLLSNIHRDRNNSSNSRSATLEPICQPEIANIEELRF